MNQQIQPTSNSKRELKELLQGEHFKREVGALLPKTITAERFVRIAFQAAHRNPELLKTTQESFFNCLLQLAAMGLEPDGRRAHLIPFGKECTLVVDYKGIKELIRRNGDVAAMHSDVVGENDEFNLRFGTHGILDHRPNLQNRGRILGAYSWVKLPDGNEEYDWMEVAEIESIRNRSRSPNRGPWVTDWNEMAKKTIFRRHAKGLPLSPQTRDAIDRDNDPDSLSIEERFKAAQPARATVYGQGRRNAGVRTPNDRLSPQSEQDAALAGLTTSEERQEAPESGTDEPAGASLAEHIGARLSKHGFSTQELLAIMVPLRMADKSARSLSDCSDEHLARVLDQWDNVLLRLQEARTKAQPPLRNE